MEIFLTILTQTIEICSKRTNKFANVCEIHFVKSGIDNEIDETKFFLQRNSQEKDFKILSITNV